ncbi:MAG: hypothetical protein R6T98_06595 [Desulfatiglandales bacterium]
MIKIYDLDVYTLAEMFQVSLGTPYPADRKVFYRYADIQFPIYKFKFDELAKSLLRAILATFGNRFREC